MSLLWYCGTMKLKVTHHAQDRLDMRGIGLEAVKQILRKPSKCKMQSGQCVAEGIVEGKLLRVVYVKQNAIFTIITSYYVD